ncbi:MAG: beta-galactosidase, partial [Victivallales bacterium]|nr:beta-galactosidase [Victivallales bacterium]
NQLGNVPAQDLPGGTYYKDEIGENGAFKVSEMVVKPRIGIALLEVPEEVRGKEIAVKVTLARPVNGQIRIELIDSPYRRTWIRRTFKVGERSQEHSFTIGRGGLPTLAGYVRATLIEDERIDDVADAPVFFPSNSIDDYLQMAWDGSNCAPGDLMQGRQVDELGWNYVLTHPTPNGENLRALALLNQKKVLYTTRIMIKKGKDGALELGHLGMMDKETRAEVDKIEGEHCLYDERFYNAWAKMIESRIKDYSKYSIALYSLGDENELAYDTGYGENNLRHFREFLETRYETIEKLNENWHKSYNSFGEVPHLTLKEAKDAKNYAAWRDHRAFMEKMYADMHVFSSDVIKQIDPDARVGAEGSVPGDLELSMAGLEFWGPYSSAVGDELLRSFAGDKVRTIWWGGYPGSHGGRGTYPNPLLRDLVRGCVNGSAWFACMPGSNHSAFTCDLDYAQYVKRYMPELRRMRRGAAQELIGNPLYMHDKILIYWSHPSSQACQLDARCPNPNDSIIAIINDLYSKGLGFDFVSVNCLDRLNEARVLFLCGASALSDDECRAILDFAKNGGIVVIDANPAIMNEYLCPRKNSPFELVIGDMNWNSAFSGKLRKEGNVQKTVYGTPVERRHGKGFIRMLGYTLGVYSATNDDFSTSFLKSVFELGNGIESGFSVRNGKPNMLFRIRDCGDHRILGAWVTENTMNSPMVVKLPYDCYIYKLDGGFVGRDEKVVMPFRDTPLELYSCFDREQKPPRFKVGNTVFGKAATLVLPPLKRGRYYRLEIFTPRGKLRSTHVFDRQENVPLISFASEEPYGEWTAVLTDVATGLASRCDFKYGK